MAAHESLRMTKLCDRTKERLTQELFTICDRMVKLVKRWKHEGVLNAMQDRLDRMPEAMGVRRQTVEHPFGTLSLDGHHPLSDPDPRQAPNRDEPPRPGLQHQANDHIFGVGPLITAIRS
jgi:hypothetical protein